MGLEELKKYEGEDASPYASAMIESFRSIGYNLATAVADIIDNSIAARANNVWIDFEWIEEKTYITISDDGDGMSETELIRAMRPGSKNPLADRDESDLGRFGLGLKTASFSQCRNLTVVTKTLDNGIKYRSWNLNYVAEIDEWKVLKYPPDDKFISRLEELDSGTTIIWQDLDRVISTAKQHSKDSLDHFLSSIDSVKKHLAMVFHRFLESNDLTIWIKNRKLEPWDPFLRKEGATQDLQEEWINSNIQVLPFVLPLHSKIDRSVFENAAGTKGWNSHQGFYIYRNNRLLVYGDWLGMYKQEEHYKLARIFVNIPATVSIDKAWQLDIKKSIATPPTEVRRELKKIADRTRKKAVEVYRQIGKKKQRSSKKETVLVWTDQKSKGKRYYKINRSHPIIKSFIENHPESKAKLNRLLRLIEETVPLPLIVANETENNDFQTIPFEGKASADMVKMVVELFETFLNKGMSRSEAIDEILCTEPFSNYPELMENLQ